MTVFFFLQILVTRLTPWLSSWLRPRRHPQYTTTVNSRSTTSTTVITTRQDNTTRASWRYADPSLSIRNIMAQAVAVAAAICRETTNNHPTWVSKINIKKLRLTNRYVCTYLIFYRVYRYIDLLEKNKLI